MGVSGELLRNIQFKINTGGVCRNFITIKTLLTNPFCAITILVGSHIQIIHLIIIRVIGGTRGTLEKGV